MNYLGLPLEWKEYYSKYPHGFTIWEAIVSWTEQVNIMIDHLNLTDEQISKLFTDTLPENVENVLNQWFIDGRLADLIELDWNGLNTKVNTKVSKGELVLNVKDFGAKGDGITDDTAAFRTVLRSLLPQDNFIESAQTGRIIYVPAGTYIISDTLYLHKGDVLRGDGGTASNLKGSTDKLVIKMGYGLINGVEIEDAGGLVPMVENMFISSTLGGNGIEAKVSGWKIKGCWFMCGFGIVAGGTDGFIESSVSDGGAGFIAWEGNGLPENSSHSLIISNCNSYAAQYGGIAIKGGGSILIDNCFFNYSKQYSIYTNGVNGGDQITIQNCKFATSYNAAFYNVDQSHIFINAGVKKLNIVNCEFKRGVASDITLSHGSIEDVYISGCRFYNSLTNAINVLATSGITTIFDCYFKDTGNYPILANARVNIKNCDFMNPHINTIPVNEYDKGCIKIETQKGNRVFNCTTNSTSVYVVVVRSEASCTSILNKSDHLTYDSYYYVNGVNYSILERGINPVDMANFKTTI